MWHLDISPLCSHPPLSYSSLPLQLLNCIAGVTAQAIGLLLGTHLRQTHTSHFCWLIIHIVTRAYSPIPFNLYDAFITVVVIRKKPHVLVNTLMHATTWNKLLPYCSLFTQLPCATLCCYNRPMQGRLALTDLRLVEYQVQCIPLAGILNFNSWSLCAILWNYHFNTVWDNIGYITLSCWWS